MNFYGHATQGFEASSSGKMMGGEAQTTPLDRI